MSSDNHEMSVSIKLNDSLMLNAKKLLDDTRAVTSDLILHIFSVKNIKKEFFPFLVILFRMRETISAAELLLYAKHERDTATLMLTLMELRYDALYIAKDLSRANDWLEHDQKHKKPWSVGYLIDQLFVDQNEKKAEKENYRNCSMIKHGNPVGGTASFPLGIEDRWLSLKPNKFNPRLVVTYLLWCCSECDSVAKAALNVFDRNGIIVEDFKQRFEAIDHLRDEMIEVNIKKAMVEYRKRQGNKSSAIEDLQNERNGITGHGSNQ